MPEVPYFFQEQGPRLFKPRTLSKFITAHAQDLTCPQYAVFVVHADSEIFVDSRGLFVRQSTIDTAIRAAIALATPGPSSVSGAPPSFVWTAQTMQDVRLNGPGLLRSPHGQRCIHDGRQLSPMCKKRSSDEASMSRSALPADRPTGIHHR